MIKLSFLKNYFLVFLLSLGSVTGVTAQSNSTSKGQELSRKELRKLRPAYINVGVGLSAVNFRDFATSPLIYSGAIKTFSVGQMKADALRERELGAVLTSGRLGSTDAASNLTRFDLQYAQFFKIGVLSTEKMNTKVGGMINLTTNIRINPSLMNQAFGLEIIPTLFGSVKLTRDISRKEEKRNQFLFIKYKLNAKQRNVAFRTNIGLFNSSYRNGYSYLGHTEVLNDPKFFDGYEFKAFSGFRIGTSLDYTRYLKNRNAFQISYVWDALVTGAEYEKFEMAAHTLKFSLLFNTL